MALRIATWNVNSVRRRLDGLARFCAEAAPDGRRAAVAA
jgi:exonuclease III